MNVKIRDYDKEPIVIKDYNPLFLATYNLYLVPFMIFIYIFNPGGASSSSLSFGLLVIVPAMMIPYIKSYFDSKDKRKIVLTNDSITFYHEDTILEKIALEEITDIKKTYSDYYHESQNDKIVKFVSLILFPLIITVHIPLIISKLIFHIYHDSYKSYRFFDAIIIFSDTRVINILPSKLSQYEELNSYFKAQIDSSIEIDNLKIYFETTHKYEKINQEKIKMSITKEEALKHLDDAKNIWNATHEAGVKSIDLNYVSTNIDLNGNLLSEASIMQNNNHKFYNNYFKKVV